MQNTMHRLSTHGDVIIRWDPDKPDEVARAKEEFDRLLAAGFLMFATRDEFEPSDGKLRAAIGASDLASDGERTDQTRPAGEKSREPVKPAANPDMPVGPQKEFKPRARRTVAVPRQAGG